jgi:hypothetical protein
MTILLIALLLAACAGWLSCHMSLREARREVAECHEDLRRARVSAMALEDAHAELRACIRRLRAP